MPKFFVAEFFKPKKIGSKNFLGQKNVGWKLVWVKKFGSEMFFAQTKFGSENLFCQQKLGRNFLGVKGNFGQKLFRKSF